MIVFIIFILCIVSIIALLIFAIRRNKKASLKRFFTDCLLVAICIIVWFVLEGKSKYEIGRDSICSFAEGRFQIWAYGNDLYAFSDEASQSVSNNAIFDVLKWKVSKDKCFLIGKDKYYHIVNLQTGEMITYSSFDSIPKEYTKSFHKMIHWGSYGQFWEDFKNENWKIAALATIFLLYGLHIVRFLFEKARTRKRARTKCGVDAFDGASHPPEATNPSTI